MARKVLSMPVLIVLDFADNLDTACTRDNLGRVWEMKGDLDKAIEWRTKGAANGKMVCSYYNVCTLPRYMMET